MTCSSLHRVRHDVRRDAPQVQQTAGEMPILNGHNQVCSPANFDVKGVLPCQNTGEMLPSISTDQQVKGVLHGNEYKCN